MAQEIETAALTLADVRFNDQGLVPCIVQDVDTMNVLMMAWMNEESLRLSIEQCTTWFYSRSRQKLWHKGEESGNTQELVALHYDCDADTLLALVRPKGPACHTGHYTCFYRAFELPGLPEEAEASAEDGQVAPPNVGLKKNLGIRDVGSSPQHARGDMPIVPGVLQPAGFLHGGATISLLESCASWASWMGVDHDTELSFGSHIDVRHVNAARKGYVHGAADLERVDDLGERGRKEHWRVEATDDAGNLVSVGTITTRVVSKEYFSGRK